MTLTRPAGKILGSPRPGSGRRPPCGAVARVRPGARSELGLRLPVSAIPGPGDFRRVDKVGKWGCRGNQSEAVTPSAGSGSLLQGLRLVVGEREVLGEPSDPQEVLDDPAGRRTRTKLALFAFDPTLEPDEDGHAPSWKASRLDRGRGRRPSDHGRSRRRKTSRGKEFDRKSFSARRARRCERPGRRAPRGSRRRT